MTFLFTDIEGSTRPLHELGPARYTDALAEHRRIVRGTAAAHGGVDVVAAFAAAVAGASDTEGGGVGDERFVTG